MYSSMQRGRLLSSVARPCRFIAHRRYPALVGSTPRRFQLSRGWQSSAPSDPEDARGSSPASLTSDIPTINTEHTVPGHDASSITSPSAERAGKKEASPYGSAVRRALRNRKSLKEWAAPTATVPSWFYERNTVVNGGDGHAVSDLPQQVKISKPGSEKVKDTADGMAHGGNSDGKPSESSGVSNTGERYALTEALWEELCASATVSYTHLTLPTNRVVCRSRWSPYH